MFRDGWASHRCIIPASFFFEWGMVADSSNESPAAKKTKFAIQPKGESVTWLAGISRLEESYGVQFPVFSILTKDAVGEMRSVHDRMPVMFRKEMIPEWLSQNRDPARTIRNAIQDLVIEKAVG